jgi:phage-related minor tail protein
MGEAGPEAIMPLKRDQQGNLGVRGGGGSVEVVVNNYTTAQAETRETTDSRGNRRIEVVVGDMTAGEVTRGGSSTNRAITNTFGMKPQLIRR